MNCAAQFAQRAARMQRSAVREFLKLTSQPGMISFAGGLPAPDLFPVEAVRDAAQAVLDRLGPSALQYSESEGIPELRDWIAARFSTSTVSVRREHILITHGAQQALQLLGQIFLEPGDRVAVENPTYLALLSAWRPLGAEFVPVPSDADGMQVDRLAESDEHPPKLVYTQPNFQNPQGTTLSLARRDQLARWASEHGVVVVEDNAYGELRYEGDALPHLWTRQVTLEAGAPDDAGAIHVGTFSKVLAPGLRLGWIVAPSVVIDKLVQAKQAADLHTSTFNQHIALELIRRGALEQQLPKLRAGYRARRDAMLAALARFCPPETRWTQPQGGMFLLVKTPEGVSTRALLPEALRRQVAFVPGDEFHLAGGGADTFRLNFSNPTPAQIEEGVRRLGELLHEAAGTRVPDATIRVQ